jgi:hypothetical protein
MRNEQLYATRRAELRAQAQHAEQHKHCPGFDPGRYHPLWDYRCPQCEGNTTPPVRSQWAAMARAAERAQATEQEA